MMLSSSSSRTVYPRVIVLLLGIALIAPVWALNATDAEASCTQVWSSSITRSKVKTVGEGRTITMTVTYKLGYTTCNMNTPNKIKVVTFSNRMAISGLGSEYHLDYQAVVLDWFTDFGPSGAEAAYVNNTHYTHFGDGTWTRTLSPGTIIPFDSRAATGMVWTGCGFFGVGTCWGAFKFYANTIHSHWDSGNGGGWNT